VVMFLFHQYGGIMTRRQGVVITVDVIWICNESVYVGTSIKSFMYRFETPLLSIFYVTELCFVTQLCFEINVSYVFFKWSVCMWSTFFYHKLWLQHIFCYLPIRITHHIYFLPCNVFLLPTFFFCVFVTYPDIELY
jgi:hypothetical protein